MGLKDEPNWPLMYAVLGIIMLLLHYIIPYTILKDARGLELYTFWSILVLIWIIVTILFIEKRWS